MVGGFFIFSSSGSMPRYNGLYRFSCGLLLLFVTTVLLYTGLSYRSLLV